MSGLVNNIQQERPVEETIAIYDQWAQDYDKDVDAFGLGGHRVTVDFFHELRLDKSLSILDVGAGTGKLGANLTALGYTNLYALDGSSEMLSVAKERNVYKAFIKAFLGEDHRVPLPDNEFHAAIMAGVFCPGHLGPDAFPELIRLVKPGGIICWGQRAPHYYAQRSVTFQGDNFNNEVVKLVTAGKWDFVKEPVHLESYNEGMPGLAYAMRVK